MNDQQHLNAIINVSKQHRTLHYRKNLDVLLLEVLAFLVIDKALLERNADQALDEHWAGYRECHSKPALLLIH